MFAILLIKANCKHALEREDYEHLFMHNVREKLCKRVKKQKPKPNPKPWSRRKEEVVAKRAGVSVGTLYQYFDSKSEITEAVADQYYGNLKSLLVNAHRATFASPTI